MRRDGTLIRYSYGELCEASERDAAKLAALGLSPGDRVALCSENRPEWIRAYLGIAAGHMTAVPLDAQLKEPELRLLLELSEARVLIISARVLATLSAEGRAALVAAGVVLLDLERDLEPVAGSPPLPGPPPAGSPDDRDPTIASLLFTSGTTGQPKGVLLSHESLLFVSRESNHRAGVGERDAILSILPLHHVFEFSVELSGLLARATMSYVAEVRGDLIAETMREAGTTIVAAVPRLLSAIAGGIQRKVEAKGAVAAFIFSVLVVVTRALRKIGLDLRRRVFHAVHEGFGGKLRFFLSGAAPLAPETWRDLDDLGVMVLEGYGLTETSPMVAASLPDQRRPGSVGVPYVGVEVRVAEAALGGDGEIVVRGPSVMRGYFRDPQGTAAVLRDGWFHTGDLGRIGPDGHLVITGRVKDLIVTPAGKKVSPVELEARYARAGGVQEICVVGARVAGGEEVHAAIVVDPAAIPEGADTRAHLVAELERVGDTLPAYQRLMHFELVPELPKTTTLKVRRHEVRRILAELAAAAGARPAEALDVDDRVLALIRAQVRNPGAAVVPEATLQIDLGLDSLDRVELLSAIEARLGVRIAEGCAEALHRVSDVLDAVAAGVAVTAGAPDGRDAPPPAEENASSLPVFRACARALYRLRAEGVENLPEGPVILCPNHESHLDVFFVKSVLPGAVARRMVCFAKREHFEGRLTRRAARMVGAVPVDRDGDARGALRAGAAALAAGRPLLIHPEGTRTKTGTLGPFRAGAAMLAIEHQVPIVPVRLLGAFDIYPPSKRLPRLLDWRRLRRLRLEVRFGQPIAPPPRDTTVKESAEALTRRVRADLVSL